MSGTKVDREKIEAAVLEGAHEGELRCAEAFRIARDLGARPLAVGQTADAAQVRLIRCQLGLFGYGEQKTAMESLGGAETVAPELAQAIREGLVLDKLPCAVAWSLARRFKISKIDVANAAEALGVRIWQCQLGAF
jgi:hypothetical protein